MKYSGLYVVLFLIHSLQGFCQHTLIPYRKGNMWGYASEDGKIKIEPKFDKAYFFREDDLARVEMNGLFGYINRHGEIVIKPEYKQATDFSMGIAEVQNGNETFCINTTGEKDECTETYAETEDQEPEEEKFVLEKNDKGYRLIIKSKPDTLSGFFESIRIQRVRVHPTTNYFAIVENKGVKSAYNEWGDLIAPPAYKEIEILDLDSYKAFDGKKWGVVNFDQSISLPFAYDDVIQVAGGQFIIRTDNKFGIVNNENQVILSPEYDDIIWPKSCSCALEYVVKSDGLYGLADDRGRLVIKPKYLLLQPFNGGPITKAITVNKKEGYINRNGKEYFSD